MVAIIGQCLPPKEADRGLILFLVCMKQMGVDVDIDVDFCVYVVA